MSAVDIPQIIHMCFSGIMGLAALYFKVTHSKMAARVATLEEKTVDQKKRLNKLESGRRK